MQPLALILFCADVCSFSEKEKRRKKKKKGNHFHCKWSAWLIDSHLTFCWAFCVFRTAWKVFCYRLSWFYFVHNQSMLLNCINYDWLSLPWKLSVRVYAELFWSLWYLWQFSVLYYVKLLTSPSKTSCKMTKLHFLIFLFAWFLLLILKLQFVWANEWEWFCFEVHFVCFECLNVQMDMVRKVNIIL